MRDLLLRLFFIILIAGSIVPPDQCFAQAPDSSRARVINDTSVNKTNGPDTSNASHAAAASEDDSLAFTKKPHPYQPNPKKSGLYSAILPGLGQAYNHQYWKVPVVYVGMGIAGYFIITNLNNYQTYRKAYIGRLSNPYPTDQYVNIYTTDQLQQLQSDYSKYLDLTVLFTALGYAMQVVDAITAAHLKNFDISRDISMRVAPVVSPYGMGMGLVMNFK